MSIKHPRANARNANNWQFQDKNGSLSTSGDYQLYFEIMEKISSYLNPFTGYPVENVYSVTVINPSATWQMDFPLRCFYCLLIKL